MPTTDTRTKQPDTKHDDPTTQTATIPGAPGNSQPQRPTIDDAPARKATSPARVGVAFAIAAAIGVGALVWAVIAGPTDTSVDTSTYDRVEANRADTLRNLTTQPATAYDRVEANRADTLRNLTTQPATAYDRVEANRADTLRNLTTQPATAYDRVEANRADTLRNLTTQPATAYDRVEANRADTLRNLTTQLT